MNAPRGSAYVEARSGNGIAAGAAMVKNGRWGNWEEKGSRTRTRTSRLLHGHATSPSAGSGP